MHGEKGISPAADRMGEPASAAPGRDDTIRGAQAAAGPAAAPVLKDRQPAPCRLLMGVMHFFHLGLLWPCFADMTTMDLTAAPYKPDCGFFT